MGADRGDRRTRGLDRLITFADAVVAIAATLLVLPLVDSVSPSGIGTVHELLTKDRHALIAFALSFGVIWRFWLVHHSIYENVIDYSRPLVWCIYLYLFGIVFLPYPTEILGTTDSDSVASLTLYIGTLFVIIATNLGQQWIITRTPALQAPDVRGTLTVIPAATTTVAIVIAFVVAVSVPAIGLWSLLLLTTTGFADRWLMRRRPPVRTGPKSGSES